ncbi:hypothetical protein A8H36_05360 [Burkholderia thailandensis]|nr:hypothetical protein A8H36_05360 [Burkholderia thailandensis]
MRNRFRVRAAARRHRRGPSFRYRARVHRADRGECALDGDAIRCGPRAGGGEPGAHAIRPREWLSA